MLGEERHCEGEDRALSMAYSKEKGKTAKLKKYWLWGNSKRTNKTKRPGVSPRFTAP